MQTTGLIGRWRLGLVVGALALALRAMSCAPTEGPETGGIAATPAPPVTLSVAHLFVVTQPQVFVGYERGLFAKELPSHVTLDRRAYKDGTALMSAFRNDEIDIAYVGSVPALLSFAQKKNLRIVAGTNIGGTVVIARADRGIETVADLKGKTVAVPALGNFQDVALRASILKEAGLEPSADPDPEKVRIITSSTAEMLVKLREGSADAVITFEPWGSRILLDGSVPAKMLVDWREVWYEGRYPSSVLIAHTDVIRDHRDLLKAFLRAHVEANILAEKDPDGTAQTLARQFEALQGEGLEPGVLEMAYARMEPTYDPSIDALAEFARLSRAAYPDKVPEPPDMAEMVDLSILNEVLRERGLPTIAEP